MLMLETIRGAPKALLHDHLDGGLRPATVIDLAREFGYRNLPTEDVDELATWFRRGADRKSLELYLETFQHTVGVMQERDAIARVAAECAEDLAADGVVYAEVRMAPELCTERGLTLDEVQVNDTPLRNVSLAAYVLSFTPASRLPSPCSYLTGQRATCANNDLTRTSLLDLELQGDNLSAYYAAVRPVASRHAAKRDHIACRYWESVKLP